MKYSLPNLLTLSRIPMMFIVVALLHLDFPWSATICFWLYIAAALTDWLDGKIARSSTR
jgi:phosphatidylglycerophosphate synthase